MKNKKHVKFSTRSGIVKVDHEKEEWHVIYAYRFNFPKNKNELGQCISKGKTQKEALKNAVINLSDHLVKLENYILKMEEGISKFFHKMPRLDSKIILGYNDFEVDHENNKIVEKDTKSNADVGIDDNGTPFTFIG